MKKEYCKVVSDSCIIESFERRLPLEKREIKPRLNDVWTVQFGTNENPHEMMKVMNQYCEKENLNFISLKKRAQEGWGPLKDYEVKEEDYEGTDGFIQSYQFIRNKQSYQYMTNKNGEKLLFFSELDAFNYLSENGGWYIDHIVPANGNSIGLAYIMARNIE